jgi:hypothetical protein
MQEVEISTSDDSLYVSWIYADDVSTDYAATSIPAGTLLNQYLVARSAPQSQDVQQVGLSLKAGQSPASLAAGETVQAIAVGTGAGCVTTPDQVLGTATVVSANTAGSDNGGNSTVTLALPADSTGGPLLAGCANAGDVALILLPGNGS